MTASTVLRISTVLPRPIMQHTRRAAALNERRRGRRSAQEMT